MSIRFTQYMLPNGRQKEVIIDMPKKIETMANALIEKGCHFDIEILQTGIISMTCEDDNRDDPILAIELCPNGPGIDKFVEKLITDASIAIQT